MKIAVVFIIFILLSGCAAIKEKKVETTKIEESLIYPFHKEALDNGLTVIVKEVHSIPIVAVHFWVNTGSVNEDEKINGLSHFFEHMFFKGTNKWKVGEMDRIIKELGGYNNAFTSVEYTGYYVVVPSANFSTALEVLWDAMTDSVFDPEEIERERMVIKEEINRMEDSPMGKLQTEFLPEIFKGTPYARPVLGTKESLDNITRETFLNYRKAFYVPNNMSLLIIGDIDTKEVIARVKDVTGGWKQDHVVKSRHASFTFTPQTEIREKVVEKDVKQGYLALGFPNYGRLNLKESYPLEVSAVILGGGKSSRLYQRLREKEGIVTTIEAWLWDMRQAGVLGVEAIFPPENFNRIKSEILEEIENLKNGMVEEEELDRAKAIIEADFAFSNETGNGMAITMGQYQILSRAEEALEYLKEIRRVTKDDIRAVMRKYAHPDRYSMVYVRPKKSEPQQ
jgi:zinc protease